MSHLISDDASRGFSAYFWSMLADVPRAAQYARAISAMCDAFVEREGRKPVVLDIGCGTGMLSILAAQTDKVARVYGVDVNRDVVRLATANAKRALGASRVGRGKLVEFVVVDAGDAVPDGVPPVDALVSEILGTLIHSEDAFRYVSLYARRLLAEHASGHTYIVPRRCTQLMTHRRFDRVPAGLRVAVQNAVNRAWTLRCWSPTNENGLSVLLHAFPSAVLASAPVRVEDYSQRPPKLAASAGTLVPAAEGADGADGTGALHLVLLEWTVLLWDGVPLHNTADALRRASRRHPSSAVARDSAWGFVAVPCFFGTPMGASTRGRDLAVDCNGHRADGPPSGDFRDDATGEGTPLAVCRCAADLDLCREMVRGFLAWLGAGWAGLVVLYDDPTSGVLLHALRRALPAHAGFRVVAFYRGGASYVNACEAYPSLQPGENVFPASRGWVEQLRALAEVHRGDLRILAPGRVHERRREFPVDEWPTYPPPVRQARRDEVASLPHRHFDAGVPGMAQAGVGTLLQTAKPCVAYNLFPSLAFTVAAAPPPARPAWLPATYAPVADPTCHLALHECDAAEGTPSPNLSRLRALAQRNAVRHGVYEDLLSLVARATASAVTAHFRFCSTRMPKGGEGKQG